MYIKRYFFGSGVSITQNFHSNNGVALLFGNYCNCLVANMNAFFKILEHKSGTVSDNNFVSSHKTDDSQLYHVISFCGTFAIIILLGMHLLVRCKSRSNPRHFRFNLIPLLTDPAPRFPRQLIAPSTCRADLFTVLSTCADSCNSILHSTPICQQTMATCYIVNSWSNREECDGKRVPCATKCMSVCHRAT